jgi:hypothetical protein
MNAQISVLNFSYASGYKLISIDTFMIFTNGLFIVIKNNDFYQPEP